MVLPSSPRSGRRGEGGGGGRMQWRRREVVVGDGGAVGLWRCSHLPDPVNGGPSLPSPPRSDWRGGGGGICFVRWKFSRAGGFSTCEDREVVYENDFYRRTRGLSAKIIDFRRPLGVCGGYGHLQKCVLATSSVATCRTTVIGHVRWVD